MMKEDLCLAKEILGEYIKDLKVGPVLLERRHRWSYGGPGGGAFRFSGLHVPLGVQGCLAHKKAPLPLEPR